MAGGRISREARTVVHCIIPGDLADKLHEPLRRHFREDPEVEVIVERRHEARRVLHDRRRTGTGRGARAKKASRRERRAAARRTQTRRAETHAVAAPSLPRQARPHADRLTFAVRVEPDGLRDEDADTDRLVSRFQRGDGDAFAALYMRYFDRVYAYLRVVLNDPHEAEDATQQVFTKVFEALPRYQRRGRPFRAWLFTIIRNHAISQLARNGRVEPVAPAELGQRRGRRESAAAAPETEQLVLSWISDSDLMLFFERLPLIQRQVLLLRFMLDLPNAQIATILGITPNNVAAHQHRALAFVRKRLAALGRDPQPGSAIRMHRWVKQAPVLRARRFSLNG